MHLIHGDLPTVMHQKKMRKYQEKALDFALSRPATFQAVDLGLGKTLTALMWWMNIDKPTLVIAPKLVALVTWPDEYEKWIRPSGFWKRAHYCVFHGKDKFRYFFEHRHTRLKIINYDGLKWLLYMLKTYPRTWGRHAVIFDESVHIANWNTKRRKILSTMSQIFLPQRMCMSGRPRPKGMHQLFGQYAALTGNPKEVFGVKTYSAFERKWFNKTEYSVVPKSKEAKAEILEKVQPYTFRLDANDYNMLPPVVTNEIKVDLPQRLRAQFDELQDTLWTELASGVHIDSPNAAVNKNKLRQFTQGAIYFYRDKETKPRNRDTEYLHTVKVDALKELHDSNPYHNMLVSIEFNFELNLIFRAFGKEIPFITGKTTSVHAEYNIRQWNQGELPILILHPASLSEGLNLHTGGSIITFLCLPWGPRLYEQLIGRLVRPDQEASHVVVNHIIVRNSVDQYVSEVLADDMKDQNQFLEALKSYMGIG